MAAPAAGTRSNRVPAGIPLQDGYQTLIGFSLNDEVKVWEKSGPSPGIEGGDPIEETTMHNDTWRTFSPRALKTLEPITWTCGYDPDSYTDDDDNQIAEMINVEQTITIYFPDGSTLAFFGYIQNFQPQDHTEGEQPEAQITIVPTNRDSSRAEQAPVMVETAGT